MFDINILDIIIIAASAFGGYALPQPVWAALLTEWIKKQFSKE